MKLLTSEEFSNLRDYYDVKGECVLLSITAHKPSPSPSSWDGVTVDSSIEPCPECIHDRAEMELAASKSFRQGTIRIRPLGFSDSPSKSMSSISIPISISISIAITITITVTDTTFREKASAFFSRSTFSKRR